MAKNQETNWYLELENRYKKISKLSEISELLEWDSAICLPEKAADNRGDQQAVLKGLIHDEMTSPEWQNIFEGAEKQDGLNDWQKANIREAKRLWVHATCVPKELVEKQAKAVNSCQDAWRKAKKENDFKSYAPHLQKVMTINREIAKIKSEKLGLSLYDAMLDEYQPGLKSETIDKVFGDLKTFLPKAIQEISQKQGASRPEFKEDYPVEKQKAFLTEIMQNMEFDFARGRMDRGSSAFLLDLGNDARVVSRFDEKNPLRSVISGMHETGHALYEQHRPLEWADQPVGKHRGIGVHESQSLLMVSQVYQSPEFMGYVAEKMHKYYNTEETKPENLKAKISKVEPSLIRVNADDVTYPLHVIMRYEIEKDLLEGKMNVSDLPKVWGEKSKEYLGVEPQTDTQGCLQDVHWSSGYMGYFPNYAIGTLLAAQFFEAAKKEKPEIADELKQGSFKSLNNWLSKNVHQKASLNSFEDLIKEATGKEFSAEAFKRSIRDKYHLNGNDNALQNVVKNKKQQNK
ncbi:MAG: carboxypeptidase M32 [Alphaproteobacteria bacterium]